LINFKAEAQTLYGIFEKIFKMIIKWNIEILIKNISIKNNFEVKNEIFVFILLRFLISVTAVNFIFDYLWSINAFI